MIHAKKKFGLNLENKKRNFGSLMHQATYFHPGLNQFI